MKKLLFLAFFISFGLSTLSAQEETINWLTFEDLLKGQVEIDLTAEAQVAAV